MTTEPQHISEVLRQPVRVDFSDSPSRTKSEFAKECDINVIVRKSLKTGTLPSGSRQPMYGDFSNSYSFQKQQTAIAQANSEFMELPSEIRAKFGNDVANLLDYLQDPENNEEAIELGLLPKPEPEQPIVSESPAAEAASSNDDLGASEET